MRKGLLFSIFKQDCTIKLIESFSELLMIIMLLYPGVRCYLPYLKDPKLEPIDDRYSPENYQDPPLEESCSQCKPTNELRNISQWCSWQCAPFPDTSTTSCVLPGAQRLIFDLYEEFQTCRSKWTLIVEVYCHL